MNTSNPWPADLLECHRLLAQMTQQVEEHRAALDQAAQVCEQAQKDHDALVAELRHQLWLYRRYVFGPRRERLVEDPDQGHLFDINGPGEGEAAPPTPPAPEPGPAPAASPKKARGSRKGDFDRLPQLRFEHDLDEAEKTCPNCKAPKTRIGEDVSRVLEFFPARLEVHNHILPKYACSCCEEGGVASPPPPPRALAKVLAGPGLLAGVIVSKFGDHLPLYRLEDVFVRSGLHLPRSTLCDWARLVAEALRPLYEQMKTLALESPVGWSDDTPVTVLVPAEGGGPGSQKGRFWVFLGDSAHPYDVFDFTEDRKAEGPARFLKGFSGHLHADAYSGYDVIYRDSNGTIVEVACWAHARRKFFEARSSAPVESSLVLEMIKSLYEVEDRARPLDVEGRTAMRTSESVPILERIRTELDRLKAKLLPKSAMAQAVNYALNQWAALCVYARDGRLTIDNNAAERRLRDIAIGRKNWLFLGSMEAGPRAAVLYTILAGAKRHHLEPWAYLRDVLMQLSVDASPKTLEGLLPDRWAQAHPQHVLGHRIDEARERARRRDERRAARPKTK